MAQGSGPPRGGIGSRDAEESEFFAGDPRIAPGLPRPVGWRVRAPDGTAGYDKFGPGDTQWTPVGTPAGGGGVTQIVAGNNVSISPGGGTGVVTINANGTAATWTLANPRVFAVDGVNGNDANAGFAEAASGSAADYRAACAAAGAVAKKTLAGLAAIFPAIGAGRMAVILVAAGTYADDLAIVLGGVEGYASGCPLVRGTVTNATASSVAFSGSDADETMAGGVTATGMNAAGYNTVLNGVSSCHLAKVGGGDPGFGAVPAVPMGWRIRFDSATTTAALRNVCRQVSSLFSTDTVLFESDLPAVPVNTDVCYLEMAGFVIPAFNFAAPPNGQLGVQFVGVRSTGTWGLQFADARFTFCGANALLAQQQTDNQLATSQSFTNPILGVRTPGGGFRSETTAEINRGAATLAGLVSVTSTTLRTMQDLAWGVGCAARNLRLEACRLATAWDTTRPNLGLAASGTGTPFTFGTDGQAGCYLDGCDVSLGWSVFQGAAGTPAIQPAGKCNIVCAGFVDGVTGNNDVGMDFTRSTGSVVQINNALTPSVTGPANANIRFSSGAIDRWVSATTQELYDAAGNHVVLTGANIGNTTLTPSVKDMLNQSGVTTNPFVLAASTGISAGYKMAGVGDKVIGVIGQGTGLGGHSLIGALTGFRPVQFDSAPVVGGLVYVSPTVAGNATTTDPGGQQPLGIVVGNLGGNVGIVHFGGVSTINNLVAGWTLGLCRVYAVDFVNGNDANRGYSDMAATGAGAYATACAAAGAVAKKTLAGLGSIVPRFGAGRDVEIVVANGGVNTEQAYADALDKMVGSMTGYNQIGIRGTGTNTTAGCVAFDGSTNDVTYQGGITVPTLNVPGYNPSGASTTSLPCLKVGGAAAALPAEPAAPLGWRVRFDAATATAGLRNQCRQIAQVVGDTITPQTAFSNAPTNADVFYIEQSGWTFPDSTLAFNNDGTGTPGLPTPQLSGGRCTGNLSINGQVSLSFSGSTIIIMVGLSIRNISQFYAHPVLSFIVVGGGHYSLAGGSDVVAGGNEASLGYVAAGGGGTIAGVTAAQGMQWGSGSYSGGTLVVQNCSLAVGVDTTVTPHIGSDTALAAPRIVGGRLRIQNSRLTLGLLSITNSPNPAITVAGQCDIAFKQVVSGSTGNGNVGMDLTAARGCRIILGVQPTVTGTAGDVRLAGGQIITWAQAMAGIVDSAGNRIIGTTNPSGEIKFSGTLLGAAGAVFSYLADAGPGLAANLTTRPGYPSGLKLYTRLKVTSISNTAANAVTVTLFKNGVATTMVVSIPAGSAAFTVISDAAHPQLFADNDTLDLRMDDGADVAAVVNASAMLEYAA